MHRHRAQVGTATESRIASERAAARRADELLPKGGKVIYEFLIIALSAALTVSLILLGTSRARRKDAALRARVTDVLVKLKAVPIQPNEVATVLRCIAEKTTRIYRIYVFDRERLSFEVETDDGWAIHFTLTSKQLFEVYSAAAPDRRYVAVDEWGSLMTPIEILDYVDPMLTTQLFDRIDEARNLEDNLESFRVGVGSEANELS